MISSVLACLTWKYLRIFGASILGSLVRRTNELSDQLVMRTSWSLFPAWRLYKCLCIQFLMGFSNSSTIALKLRCAFNKKMGYLVRVCLARARELLRVSVRACLCGLK